MKLSTILSFTALSATATLAFPLLPFRGLRARNNLEERDVYAPAPVRRSDVASSAAPTATESSTSSTATDASSSATASATSTTSASEATSTTSDSSSSSGNSTDTWLYSTITQNGSMTTPPASTSTLDPSTETASTTTETDYPQSTSTGRNNGNNNNNNNNNNVDIQITIRIKEVIKVKQVIVVERPILVAVQVNIKVRQTIIVNQIRDVFISRFDTWDQNVVDQLGLVISQQFDILTRSSHSGFDNLSNDQYNQFVSKFISQFEIFQSFKLVDVQQFVTVLKSFGVGQLATFFGRSDALFNHDTLSRFNVNNDFRVFVQQLTVIVAAVSVDSFNSDDLFGLSSGSLIVAGSI